MSTQGDLAVRGAAAPERLAAGLLDTYLKGQGAAVLPIFEKLALRDTGIKIVHSVRTGAGDQIISGVGFQPSAVIFLTGDNVAANVNLSWGFDILSLQGCFYLHSNGAEQLWSNLYSLYLYQDGIQFIRGSISTFNSDGFVITWDSIGTPEIKVISLCLP